ncbi:MAG: Holliday junction branch migration protein RuvA [SAR324 cluster bacterium]|uniref:Holliday junction branch migration complex subunit RuvA n=1 Tax=SAR324 cluster bacterium TaxID=2024889 RepID=A0A7X9IL06_9DELT|nr:Holliday junction branch migration protein RuvA [SAR324 cluster bacterium]
MISSLRGILEEVSLGVATIVVNGVGYEVWCTKACQLGLSVGGEVHVVTYTDVKEDSIRLYGFQDSTERQVFLLLLKVSGVGAKSAVEILSHIDKLELLRIIGAGDAGRLQKIKGIGRKTAERIIVELKDRVSEFAESGAGIHAIGQEAQMPEAMQDALAALTALGFAKRDAERAMMSAKGAIRAKMTPGEIVREALRFI